MSDDRWGNDFCDAVQHKKLLKRIEELQRVIDAAVDELHICDLEEAAYLGGGDWPCGGPVSNPPDTVSRVLAILRGEGGRQEEVHDVSMP